MEGTVAVVVFCVFDFVVDDVFVVTDEVLIILLTMISDRTRGGEELFVSTRLDRSSIVELPKCS